MLKDDQKLLINLQDLMNRFKIDFEALMNIYKEQDKNLTKTKEYLKHDIKEIPLKQNFKGKLKLD